jgi:hypothetical protein
MKEALRKPAAKPETAQRVLAAVLYSSPPFSSDMNASDGVNFIFLPVS